MRIKDFSNSQKLNNIDFGLSPIFAIFSFIAVVLVPMYIYNFGAGIAWAVLGAFVCLFLVWVVEAGPLMIYSRRHQHIFSIPSYLNYRFKKRRSVAGMMAAAEILILMLLMACIMIRIGAKIVYLTIGVKQPISVVVMIIIATCVVGFRGAEAQSRKAHWKVVFLTGVLLAFLLMILSHMKLGEIVQHIMRTKIKGSVSEYLNVMFYGGEMMKVEDYISLFSIGFLLLGSPILLGSFFMGKNLNMVVSGRRFSSFTFVLVMSISMFLGGVTRGYLYPRSVTHSLSEFADYLFEKLWMSGTAGKVIAVLFLILVIESVLAFVKASFHIAIVITLNDIIKNGRMMRITKKNESRGLIFITVIIAFIALVISSMIPVVSLNNLLLFNIVLSCSIGPVVFLSTVWKRFNMAGAVAGMLSGFAAVPFLMFAHIPLIENSRSVCDIMGINAVLPAMVVSFLFAILVTLITKKPEEGVIEEFEEVKNHIF